MTFFSLSLKNCADDSPELEESGMLKTVREGRLLIVTLNRPDRLNALTPQLHEQLLVTLQQAARDTTVGAVVLTGAGRAFCSGGDMQQRDTTNASKPRLTLEERADNLRHHGETAKLLYTMPKPTIAMVNGVAAGAGLALALACDMRVAARDALFTTSYVHVAMSGDLGVSYFLTRLVGSAKARELMFLSDKISADEALRIGMVTRIETGAGLLDTTLHIARKLADGPAVALRYIKQNLVRAETASLDEVIEGEAFHMARCGRTQDVKEAVAAFREKRPPHFNGS